MNNQIKEAWVQALRSGDYNQGNLHLNIQQKYYSNGVSTLKNYHCPLGVVCDLHTKQEGGQ